MNREIKFRAWDKKHNRMIVPKDFNEVLFDHGRLFVGHTIEYGTHDEFNEFELMQFTGITDKNGKEIYEGDIVRYTTPYLDHPRDFKIVFNDGMFCQIEISPRGYVDEGEEAGFWIDWEDLTIIGNIYENPELTTTL